ncbi:NAD(P)/FAD-dependent oxidoreductase [Rhodococcus sp. X156]|uniref:flavin-containing monooxygenase n=1 Tax=Rhodococcus sp. X156 TaxID=2499145 RepID=UPI000FDAB955|nr:NAD(P)/FAD-dependent oxidoreductase [Rhodococcus sp. X156]
MTTATDAAATPAQDRAPSQAKQVDVLIIGSGFSGLGAAIKLTQAGKNNYVVIERGADVGGTWRDNTYPGAACDVPSHLYSYSFALNPEWSRSFSRQAEIQDYLEQTARRYDVLDKHVFGCEMESARWNSQTQRWDVQTSKGRWSAATVISAVGALCEPALPNIAGIEDFTGEIFHSARWNHDSDLTGKRVAVIGTGASGIQIVPAVAPQVAHMDVYQRTAPWILPRFDREYTRVERFAFRHVPGFQKLSRGLIYAMRETQVVALAKDPRLTRILQRVASKHMAQQVPDAELRKKVTPTWRIGCKRMLISNNWYPALQRDNVDLVTDGIDKVTSNAVVTKDGTVREVDAIVVATGFHVTDSPTYETIVGADGRTLAEHFAERGMQAYKGSAVTGFPNMFFLVGPNTGLGHTSMVYMIESQLSYVLDAVDTVARERIATVEVRPEVQQEYNAMLQRKLDPTVWMRGGCASWYLDAHGNNTTLWPDFTFAFRKATKSFDLDAYRYTRRAAVSSTAGPSTAAPAQPVPTAEEASA